MQYYPSGLPWAEAAGSSEQPWKYNGKEFVEMHGLDEYDSKARWYYPAICRTTTMDPLAETYYPTSPYAWCGNNTIIFTDANGCWFDFSGMTNEEKTAFDSDLSSLKDIPVFQKLYAELEESPERYSIQFGKTTYLDEHYVEGQFVPSKEGGGSITFLSRKQINSSVAAEEFFHAYQHHNRNSYADGEFNREFEAKTFVTLLVEHMGVGYVKGMFDFQQNIIFGVYSDNNHNTPVLYNSNFERDYLKYANIYANYNKTNNIGNYNYQRNTIIPPFSLKTLFNF
jgi:RHS repeat-associated protein